MKVAERLEDGGRANLAKALAMAIPEVYRCYQGDPPNETPHAAKPPTGVPPTSTSKASRGATPSKPRPG